MRPVRGPSADSGTGEAAASAADAGASLAGKPGLKPNRNSPRALAWLRRSRARRVPGREKRGHPLGEPRGSESAFYIGRTPPARQVMERLTADPVRKHREGCGSSPRNRARTRSKTDLVRRTLHNQRAPVVSAAKAYPAARRSATTSACAAAKGGESTSA